LPRLLSCEYMRMRADMRNPDSEHVDLAVEVFRMLADPTRVRILWALLDQERSVNEIGEVLGKPQSGISQHLAKLRLARLVLPRRQRTQVFYRVANDHVRQLVADALHPAEHAGPGIPAHHGDHAVDIKEAR
jgi:ArsR family transcriptional regulator, zinc-responsive transcriptional repressor